MIVWAHSRRRSRALQMTASFTNCGRAPTIEQTRILRVEALHGLAHVLDVVLSQLGVNRQRQRLGGELLADREIPSVVAQERVALLQVEWQRIVDLGADAMILQICLESVTSFTADYELVIDVAGLVV